MRGGESVQKRAKSQFSRGIALTERGEARALVDPEQPLCVVNTAQLKFRVGVGADGDTLQIVILSNKLDKARLQVDKEAAKYMKFQNVSELLSHPAYFENASVSWATLTSLNHASVPKKKSKQKREPVVFALGLWSTREKKLDALTECFFIISNTRDRKQGPLFKWLSENISTLSSQKHFRFHRRESSKLHSCEDMVRLSNKDITLPSCCLAHVSPASSPSRPSAVGRVAGVEQPTAGQAVEVTDVLIISQGDDDDNGVALTDAAFDDAFVDALEPNQPDNSSPSPENHARGEYDSDAKGWAPPMVDVTPIALVEKVGEFWGAIGMDNNHGLFSVKIESNVGVRIFPTQKITVTISLTNIDRVRRSFAPVTLDAAPTEGVILPLPKPTRFGVELLDIVVDDNKPVTIVYLVA